MCVHPMPARVALSPVGGEPWRRGGIGARLRAPLLCPTPGWLMPIGDVAVSDPHAPAYLSAAASRPLGCAERRESAKRARHEEDVRRAGNTFTPLVLETYGALGSGAEAWFRGCIAVAGIQRPEWLEEGQDWRLRRSGSGGRGPSSLRTGSGGFRLPFRGVMLVCLGAGCCERDRG